MVNKSLRTISDGVRFSLVMPRSRGVVYTVYTTSEWEITFS